MPSKSFTAEQALIMLAAVPQRVAELTAGLPPEVLRTAPSPDAWSANDVLAHLRACADMWGGSIMTIIAEDHPTIRAINPLRWIKETDYLDLAFQPSLRAFTSQRDELLVALQALPLAGWSRAARVTGAGRPLERSVLDFAERLARHERPHIKQIEDVVGALRG